MLGKPQHAAQSREDADAGFRERHGARRRGHDGLARQGQFAAAAQRQAVEQADRQFGAVFDFQEGFMAGPGEINNILDLVRFDVLNEIADIRTGDKGFTSALDDDCFDRRILFRCGELLFQLGEDAFVQCVHCFRPVDGQPGRIALDIEIHQFEFKWFTGGLLFFKDLRHLEIRVLLADGGDAGIGLVDADFVHDLKRALDPAQSDLGPPVRVFNGGDLLVDEGGGNTETDAVETIHQSLHLGFVYVSVQVPIFTLCHLIGQGFTGGVKRPQFLAERGRRMQGNGNAGDIHQDKRAHADLEGSFAGLLDGGYVGQPLLEHPGSLVEKGYKEPVYRETRGILDQNGGLAVQLGGQQ